MSTVNLATCEQEPIHIPGSIQPHGVLLVLRRIELTICQVSANVPDVFDMAVSELLGFPVDIIFKELSEAQSYRSRLGLSLFEGKPIYLSTVRVGRRGTTLDAIAHCSGELVILEFEPSEVERDHSVRALYGLVQNSIVAIREAPSLQSLYEVCATQVRRVSGFDRVMIYRFDAEWNGEVVAESKRDDLEPFLGLHYPASDIPTQARALYTKNWLRFIADRSYVPAIMEPQINPVTGAPLDMSHCVLRSVSPVHLQYLKNMGVGASMSVSIIKDGKLWGLIACHHYSPRYVPYDVRTACELLAQIMSPSLAAAEQREIDDYVLKLSAVRDAMTRNVDGMEDLAKALMLGEPGLLDFIAADGAAVLDGDLFERSGQAPSEAQTRELFATLTEHDDSEVVATDHSASILGRAILGSVAAGVMVIRLWTKLPQAILLFRTEQVRTVDWAGDPGKLVAKSESPERLSPRGSFALWKQTVHGRSAPWSDAEITAARQFRHDLMGLLIERAERRAVINKDLRLAGVEREKLLDTERNARAEAEKLNRIKDEFIATLSHELRTPLNAILGWSQIIGQGKNVPDDIAEAADIIERNARAQSQMIEDLLEMSRIISGKLRLDLQKTHLPTVVRAAIDTVRIAADAKGVRLIETIDPLWGVHATGDPGRLQQVVWNLLSNAVKFTPKGGRIQVILERVNSHVELSISDNGIGITAEFLPHVFNRFTQADASPSRSHGGLGLGLSIVRNIVEMHGGTVTARSAGRGQGSTFIVTLPVRAVASEDVGSQRVHPKAQHQPADCESLNLAGVRVLVVEDDADSRALIEHILEECKCVVVTALNAADAMQKLQVSSFDVLLSDIGLPDEDGYTFIRKLRSVEESHRLPKLPAIALTAYARTDDRRRAMIAGFQCHIAKPVDSNDLLAIIASLAGRV